MKGSKVHEQQKEDQGKHGPTAEWNKGPGDKKNMVKVKVLHAFFISAFTGKAGLQQSQVPQTRGYVWSKEDLPSGEDQARLLLN